MTRAYHFGGHYYNDSFECHCYYLAVEALGQAALNDRDSKPVRVTSFIHSFIGNYFLPTYHVSGAVLGPGGHRPETGDKPPTSSPACGQTAVSEAGGQVCGALKADHPRRKQDDELDKSTEVPTSLVCPGGVSPLETAGQGGGDSARGQQWGAVVRGVCAARLTLPGPAAEGGASEEEKESQMALPVQMPFQSASITCGMGKAAGGSRPQVDLFFFRHKWTSQLTDTHY